MDEMHEMEEGGGEEVEPRLAAIRELLKFLRQSEAKALPQPEPQQEMMPKDPNQPEKEDLSPEALEALKSLMG